MVQITFVLHLGNYIHFGEASAMAKASAYSVYIYTTSCKVTFPCPSQL